MVTPNIGLLLMIATLSDAQLHPSLQVAEYDTVQKPFNSWLHGFTEGLTVGLELWDMGGPENKEKRKLHCVPEYGVQTGTVLRASLNFQDILSRLMLFWDASTENSLLPEYYSAMIVGRAQ